MTLNYPDVNLFTFADFVRMGVSPRFAILSQYIEPIEPSSIHLSKPFVSLPVSKHEIGMRKPNFFCLDCMAAEGRSSAEGNCRSDIKLNVIHFIINQIFKQT